MKTIMIAMPGKGYLVRNFFHTGIISRLLDEGIKVVMVTEKSDDLEPFKEYLHVNLIFEEFQAGGERRFARFMDELCRGAIYNKTVDTYYRYRFISDTIPNPLYYPIRILIFAPLKYIPGSKKFIRWVDAKINPQNAHDALVKKYRPDVVFNMATRSDRGIVKSANRLGVKTIDMPKTWDNPSKILFHTKADHIIVWSPFMYDQVIENQDYSPEEVIVTGIPQFDFYDRKDGLLSREEFCKKNGLDPSKKIILYASAGRVYCDDIGYVEKTKQLMRDGYIKNAQILVRPHFGYKGESERFLSLEDDEVVVDKSHTQSTRFSDLWDSSKEHIYHLYNTLYHADVCVNIASTMTLDATACNTPVININFDLSKSVSPHNSTKRLYKFDYTKEVMETGGTWYTRSQEEYLKALQDVLKEGKRKEEGTKRMIEHFMYKVDGKSAQRLANTLIKLANLEK